MHESEPTNANRQDPVCGMKVVADSPFRAQYYGREYLFCSRYCQNKFEADPERYLAPPLLVDLVCCKGVQPDTPFRKFYQGREYLFCSPHCQAEFQEDPEKFAAALPLYFHCPRHSGMRQAGPGHCPQCGLVLEAVKTKWVCPYHPEVLHEEPGVCPIYGMALIPEPPGRFYTCKLHREVRQLESGRCPRCGLALYPAWAPVVLVRSEWFCPEHQEIVKAMPGQCPQCGRKLEPRKVQVKEKPGG